MKNKGVFIVAGVALLVGLGIFLISHTQTDAQECRIVRIYGGMESDPDKIMLEPDTLWIDRKTCVIWTNWADGKVVSIRFSDGKRCQDTTTGAAQFRLDDTSCFVSSYVEYGGTTSLTFKDIGTYEYVVDSKDMKSTQGKIVVR